MPLWTRVILVNSGLPAWSPQLPAGLVIDANPCEKGGRLYNASRSDRVWSDENEAAFTRVASEPLRLAMILASWTGQRQGDLLRLPWSAYDGQMIRLKQSKTGAKVTIPVGAPLKAALDATKKRGPLILMNTRGRAWTANGFHASWRKARMAAEVSGVTFQDLRGTAVLRLFLARGTEAEIATITGHSLWDVRSILDSNYFCRRGPGSVGDNEIGNRAGEKRARKVNIFFKPPSNRSDCRIFQCLKLQQNQWLGDLDSNQD
jgi:hypothetical protein